MLLRGVMKLDKLDFDKFANGESVSTKPSNLVFTPSRLAFLTSLITAEKPKPFLVAFFNFLREDVKAFIPLTAPEELEDISNSNCSIVVDITLTSFN
jgi:hypothetical protein